MTHQFAKKMELKANKIAEEFEDSIYGVKCWYSAARLFDQGAQIAFIGINPGGGDDSHSHQDKDNGYLEKPYKDTNFNSWLNESWGGKPPGSSGHQLSAQRVFKILYGDDWKKVLRNTACFNVAPFRTGNVDELPSGAWEAATYWFKQVIEHVKPKLIICNGNGEGLSPWSVISDKYKLDSENRIQIGKAKAYLKQGVIQSAPLKNTRILALPHLSAAKYNHELLFQQLEKQRHKWDLP